MPKNDIYYSDKYTDDKYEYRHVMLPKDQSCNEDLGRFLLSNARFIALPSIIEEIL